MNTRLWLHRLLLVTALCLALAGDGPLRAADERPNILFVYLDDFGWRDASYMGSDFYETPHLDQLAAEGMVFTDAYSAAANCAPSRACLLSGQYTPRHKIFNVGTRPRGNAKHRRLLHVPGVSVLRPDIRTWAQQLQDAGYATATIGKWHLSRDPRPYGFDINIGGTQGGSPPRGYYPPHPVPGLEDAPAQEYLTDRLNDEAAAFIRQHQDQPWCLYLTHFAVHTPLHAKKELVGKYEAKPPGRLHDHVAMATMIQAVDDGVGRLRELLQQLKLENNTIVLFSSDNGGYGPATDMAPLKGYKGAYYEGGIRVPMFVKWPGVTAPGSKCSVPIVNVDIYPTLCEMARVDLPRQPVDGVSLAKLLSGQEDERFRDRAVFWHFPAYLQSYGGSHNREQRDPLFRTRPCSIVRQGDWKLHQYFEDGALELYNLKQDVGETTNLADSEPAKAKELLETLTAWRSSVAAPAPKKANPAFDAAAEAAAIRRQRQRDAEGGKGKDGKGKDGKGRQPN